MAAAGDGQLEAVDVESLLVGVRQQADEVVLLQAAGVEVRVDERARSSRVHALLQPLGLGVALVTCPETCKHWLEWTVEQRLY